MGFLVEFANTTCRAQTFPSTRLSQKPDGSPLSGVVLMRGTVMTTMTMILLPLRRLRIPNMIAIVSVGVL